MNRVNRFVAISETATKISNSWTNREIAMFHYFNPNGLLALKSKTDKKIDQLVNEGKAKSGAIIAHGSLNFFYHDQLQKLINKKSVRSIDLSVTIRGLKRQIESSEQYIAEKSII